jgi:hypothetical protein
MGLTHYPFQSSIGQAQADARRVLIRFSSHSHSEGSGVVPAIPKVRRSVVHTFYHAILVRSQASGGGDGNKRHQLKLRRLRASLEGCSIVIMTFEISSSEDGLSS